jgi:DNA-binding response OmpR family regulator
MSSHRILYVGTELTLLKFLQDELKDCQIVRCPVGSIARTFIERIKYSLLLLDEELPDMTGLELESFTRKLKHRERTPVIIVKDSDNFGSLISIIKQRSRHASTNSAD